MQDRSELADVLDEDDLGPDIFYVGSRPVDEATAADGTITLALPVSTNESTDPMVAWLSSPGVYPFEVVVTDAAGATIDRVTTTMLRLADTPGPTGTPLAVGVVLPVDAPVLPALDGSPFLPDDAAAAVTATLGALDAQPDVPVTLDPTPQVLQGLAARDPDSEALVRTLAPRPDRPVLSGPYAPVDAGAWEAAGLTSELGVQYDAGATALQNLTGANPDGRTGVLDRTDTGDAVVRILDLGVESVIVPSGQLAPMRDGTTATFASAFELELPDDATAPAVMADDRTAERLAGGDDPVLAAQRALAELALVQLGQSAGNPGETHGLAVVVRPETAPDALAAFLAALAGADAGASGSPGAALLEPVTTVELLRATTTAETTTGGRTTTLVRGYEADEPASLGRYPDQLRDARQLLAGMRSLVPDAPTVTLPAAAAVLSSGSRSLDGGGREAMLSFADAQIDAVTTEIVVDPDQVVTLTSSSGRVPLNLENRLPVAATVRIVMTSAKLDFPQGAVIEATLAPAATTTVELPVETRATGAFPLDVAITSADSTLAVTSTRYTVRSTAISGVGLVLSVGAGLFLLVWWARHFRTARRARRLVRSDHPALSGDDPGGYAPANTDPQEGR